MKKVIFQTLGCKVNTYETEALGDLFKNNDYQIVDDSQVADVYVINTCTVTNSGDAKSRKAIRQCIKKNPDAIICVVGCYSQTKPEDIEAIDGVDIILGTSKRNEIIELIERFTSEKEPINKVENILKVKEFENLDATTMDSRTRAFLKIQEGCNNFCTFCIIPYARGLLRSRQPEDVIDKINDLIKNNYKEVVLTGIHTAGYGLDLEDFSFSDLLEKISLEIDENIRVRISSIEASQVDDKVLEILKNNPNIFVDHLHIPIQSGSNEILKNMRRHYNKEEFINKVYEIRKIMPNVSITTDIIAGFPGETDEMHLETIQTIKDVNFSEIHVFPYSKRNGTPAAKRSDQVNDQVKKQRVKEIIELSDKQALEYAKKFENKEIEVLFEQKKAENNVGHTTNYLKIIVESDEDLQNQIRKVKITKAGYPINYGVLL